MRRNKASSVFFCLFGHHCSDGLTSHFVFHCLMDVRGVGEPASQPGFLTLCCFLQGDKFDEPCNGLDCSRGCQCLPQKGGRVSHHSHTCTKHQLA
uniref:Uncharacterized protein n=1 Tax=Oryzias sinensis TaxID=183150 RepID=A0A8C8DWL8_9TELE